MYEANDQRRGANTGGGRSRALEPSAGVAVDRGTEPGAEGWSYEKAGQVFTIAAFAALPTTILGAVLLAHGTVSGAPWAHAAGVALVLLVIVAQWVVRRRVLSSLERHHRSRGFAADQARQRAQSTLDAWLS